MTYCRTRLGLAVAVIAVVAWTLVAGACRDGNAPADSSATDGSAESPNAVDAAAHPAPPVPPVRKVYLRAHDPEHPPPVELDPAETRAMVVYSGVSHGTMAACGCENNPAGGLMKELTVIDHLRELRIPMVVVHPGDLFPFEKKPMKLPYLCQSAALLRYDAICVGEQEMIEGLDRFRKMVADFRLPYISANLADPEGQAVAPPMVIRDIAGIRVAVVAVFGDQDYLFMDDAFKDHVIVAPVAETLTRTLRDLKRQVDFIVLLSHQDKYLDRELAQAFPEVDLIVGGHDQAMLRTPLRVGHTLLVNAGVLGEQVGVVHLAVDAERHVRIIGHELIPTTAPVPKSPMIEAQYRAYVAAAGIEPLQNDTPTPPAYEPAEACAPCHQAIYDEFRRGPHARAWQALEHTGREGEKQCWYCHSMGAGFRSGFEGPEKTPKLAGVSCQACHLLPSDHTERDLKDDLLYAQNEHTCRQCHTMVTSPGFSFWEASEHVDHHAVDKKYNDPPEDFKPVAPKPVLPLHPSVTGNGQDELRP